MCINSMRMKYHLMDLRGSLRGSNDFWILLLDLELKQNNIYWINLFELSFNRHSLQDRFPYCFIHISQRIFLILRLFKISTIYGVFFFFFFLRVFQFHSIIFNDLPLAFKAIFLFWIHIGALCFHDSDHALFFALHMSTFMFSLTTLLIFHDLHYQYVLHA